MRASCSLRFLGVVVALFLGGHWGCRFDPGGLPASDVVVVAGDQGAKDISVAPEGSPDAQRITDADATPDTFSVDGPVWDIPVTDTVPVTDGPGCAGQTCPLGCNVALGRCYRLTPSNFGAAIFFDQVKTPSSTPTLFDTDTGEVKAGSTTLRAAGNKGTVDGGIFWDHKAQGSGYPELSIFGIGALTASGTIKIQGKRAFALYVTGGITISGNMQAEPGLGKVGGAGGFDGGSSGGGDGPSCLNVGQGEGGTVDSGDESGGGGGGRGASGGDGGDANNAAGGKGGQAVGNATLVPLFGGCGGGGGEDSDGGHGGGGGGAIQISANGPISVSGIITAPGAGGGAVGSGHSDSGGGGGSGGAILLEGFAVTVSGIVAANGGGGGGGGDNSKAGERGRASLTAANGGPAGSGGTKGGAGGVRGSPQGGAGLQGSDDTGGGGGAVGRIHINAPAATVPQANASPKPSLSTAVAKW